MMTLSMILLSLCALLAWVIKRFWLEEQWQYKLAKVLPDIHRV